MSSIIHQPDGGKIVKTNCFECHPRCGVLVHVDKNGKIVDIEGNPEDPRNQGRICSKGRAAIRIVDHKDRVNYPLKRVGERGEGKWERITWDEAMDTIVEKLTQIKEEFGGKTIINGQGTGRGTQTWQTRLGFRTFGVAHMLSPSHVCLFPMLVTQTNTLGMFNLWDGANIDNANTVVFWGANGCWSEATFTAGPANRSRQRDAKLIVIDPCFEHPLAAKADYFLSVRPGSDLALAMYWINTIITEKLYDEAFVKRWTNLPMLIHPDSLAPIYQTELNADAPEGEVVLFDLKSQQIQPFGEVLEMNNFDPMLDHDDIIKLTGKDGEVIPAITAWHKLRENAAEMSLSRVAELTWVEAKTIHDACVTYATNGPAAIASMQGIEEHTNCRLTINAITIIQSITGNLDILGGNIDYGFWTEMFGPELTGGPSPYHIKNQLRGPKGEGKFNMTSLPAGFFRACETGEPYYPKAWLNVQGNAFSYAEQPQQMEKALKTLDFIVSMDYFMSPTAELADIVLPSAHWLERDYIADEMAQEWLFGQQKAIEPMYERKSDLEFIRDLGRRMDPENWPWETDEQVLDFQLEQFGITYNDLREQWMYRAYPWEPKQYEKRGFKTNSGRAELYAAFFQRERGGSVNPPLPVYQEPAESPYSTPELYKEYPLIMVSGRRYPNFYHSAYRNIAELRELNPLPEAMINPVYAKAHGIKEGDEIVIESRYGKCQMLAMLSDGIHPNVCSVPHGWWQGCEELGLPGHPNHIANCNAAVGAEFMDPDMGSTAMRSTLVKIYKVGGSDNV